MKKNILAWDYSRNTSWGRYNGLGLGEHTEFRVVEKKKKHSLLGKKKLNGAFGKN